MLFKTITKRQNFMFESKTQFFSQRRKTIFALSGLQVETISIDRSHRVLQKL
jgi:hypothetical protein